MKYKDLSKELHEILKMENPAVGIKLLKSEDFPEGYDTEQKYTFCQFIMKAREGNKLIAKESNISCANGSSALGFRPVPEKLMNGEFLEKIGSFKKEGAINMMASMPRFEEGIFKGIALAPLDTIDFEPDVIVLETVPEQIMWLCLASIHESGNRHQFSTSISNGTCVDMTVVPHTDQKLNVSVGCYGCRNATNVPDNHLYVGFPGNQLEDIVESLRSINEKSMPRTREKYAYSQLMKTN